MEKSLKKAKNKIDEFYKSKKNLTGKPYEMSKGYLEWIAKKN